jgi:hypothetical protein
MLTNDKKVKTVMKFLVAGNTRQVKAFPRLAEY